ncbi:HlyD family efflux transporter periplasmic adaptor subunit [Laspinema olomoucense]|uniref:HlyD family efflux transporter periplasmic adaptor subunit n=1 Tax=Laspinema olomoucense D3b TaxID=2953688 RepID=A0ABT2N0M8_9CYAN|nr:MULTISPECIES: HlyD family efflux transporter periplasmic adaptor subunit [unclassified Laspinema]MCT7974360.1 HlyD family efflux transporter periplasmic adaptor subunit [Laspinema sp. D3d]MCT7976142.1 HlyD family efflux transporter periplasmic adaptor subunit [Laspinema sp. D3b]MCT7990739.1 HlyD family efflux transporter periplasmic adaptor subunit [Laspinema sp. D3a]
MSSNPNQPQKSPLKVVPPKSVVQPPIPPTMPASPTPEVVSPAKAPAASPFYKKGLMLLFLLGCGVAIARIPIANHVTGAGKITSRSYERHHVTTSVAGTVNLKVKSNGLVTEGDIVAEVYSAEIEQQIAQAQQSLQQANSALDDAKSRLKMGEMQLLKAKQDVAIARSRAEKEQGEFEAIIAGNNSPQIRQLEKEINSIESEIAGAKNNQLGIEEQITGIQYEIAGLEGDTTNYQKNLQILQAEIEQYQAVLLEGALAQNEFNKSQKEENILKAQINQQMSQIDVKRQQIRQYESEIRQRENLIEQKQGLIAAKYEQIAELKNKAEELRDERANELEQQLALQRSVETEVEGAVIQIQNESERVAKAEAELARLRDRQQDLILKSKITGTVVTADLDLVDQAPVQMGQELMEIVNLSELTATVEVSQEDGNLVKRNQPVIFKVRDPYSPSYRATVQEILPKIASDQSGTNPMLTLTILIENHDQSLRPGSEGFAHIATGQMRIYQKAQHELNKLFNLDKYFVGFDK